MLTKFHQTIYQEKYFRFLLLAPALIIVAVLTIYPIISVFYTSLFKYSYMQDTKTFVGLKNFSRLLNNKFFQDQFQEYLCLCYSFNDCRTDCGICAGLALQRDLSGTEIDPPDRHYAHAAFYDGGLRHLEDAISF